MAPTKPASKQMQSAPVHRWTSAFVTCVVAGTRPGTIGIGTGEGLSQSHHASLANRVGTGIRRPYVGLQRGLWTAFVQLLAARSAGLQEISCRICAGASCAGAHEGRGDRLDAGRRCLVGDYPAVTGLSLALAAA